MPVSASTPGRKIEVQDLVKNIIQATIVKKFQQCILTEKIEVLAEEDMMIQDPTQDLPKE
jgi:hypothetical protein